MKKLRGIGTAGLTLVELMISMAILAVVGVAIGGAMYVSSRSYTRGAAEVNVQEEAQVASNLICDWIVDATSVNPDLVGDPTGKTFLDGEYDYLEIIHPEGDRLIKVRVEQSGSELVYEAKDITDPSDALYDTVVGSGTLAKGLSGCYFYTTFGTDRNVKISLDFNVNDRTYRAVTDSTSRSHDFISTGGTSTVQAPVLRFGLVSNIGGSHVTLEPGQNSDFSQYTFDVFVDNCDPDTLTGSGVTYTAPGSSSTQIVSCTRVGTTNQWKVTVRSNDSATGPDNYIFTASNMAGTDTKTLQVRIRRVQDCSFVNVVTEGGKDYMVTSDDEGKANSVYESEINLNAINWEQETNIVGAHSGVYGEEGFDATPWSYYDPTELTVDFVSWSSTQNRWVSRASDVSYSWIPGANPTLHVELRNDITSSIAVVVTAPHSGSIIGNSALSSDPYCGVTVASNNRARFMDSRNLGYGPSGKAYYAVAYIKPGTGIDPFTDVGGGFRRGTPACMLAFYDSDFQSKLRLAIKAAYPGTTDSQIDISTFTYKTVLYYRPTVKNALGQVVGVGDFQSFFIYSSPNGNITDTWAEASRRLRDSSTALFELNQSYEIYLEYQVWKGTELKPELRFKTTGSIPAATPYVLNPTNSKFRLTHSSSDQVKFPKNSNYEVGLYIEGCNFNNHNWVTCRVEQLVSGTWESGNVVRVDGIVNQYDWKEGAFNGVSTIVFDDATDTRTYPIGQYQENIHDFKNQNLQIVKLNTSGLTSNAKYRLVFDTDYPRATSVNGAAGTVTTGTGHYVLTDYVYFTVN